MTQQITIVGAGMAGLLAANMLHRHKPIIVEAQPSLPNNHSAVLRFGSDKVAEVLGIPFRKVQMIKSSLPWRNPVADSLAYANKCGGVYRSDRSITSEVVKGDRWIAPPDLVERMAKEIGIQFNEPFDRLLARGSKLDNDAVISTIPMPALMKLLEYPEIPDFKHVEGANIIATIPGADAYASLYIPDPEIGYNRVSVTGNEMIVEYAFPLGKEQVAHFFSHVSDNMTMKNAEAASAGYKLGLFSLEKRSVKVKRQTYAKIQPISETARKKFMAWATDNHNVFSLGRFATWRPGLLLDDLVHDIRQIEKWITGDRWNMRLKR